MSYYAKSTLDRHINNMVHTLMESKHAQIIEQTLSPNDSGYGIVCKLCGDPAIRYNSTTGKYIQVPGREKQFLYSLLSPEQWWSRYWGAVYVCEQCHKKTQAKLQRWTAREERKRLKESGLDVAGFKRSMRKFKRRLKVASKIT